MLETILVSMLVSYFVTRITAWACLKRIDKYADDLLEMTKSFFSDLISVLDKRLKK